MISMFQTGSGMLSAWLSALLLLACNRAYAADPPAYKLTYTPCRHVELVVTRTTRMPGHAIKEWVFFQFLP